MKKVSLEVHIHEQTRRCVIEVDDELMDLPSYLAGCLDANIYPQSDRWIDTAGPQGEHSGLDALDCDIRLTEL